MLILQIIITQWDKSQITKTDILQRAAIPDSYPIVFPSAFYDFNKKCIIDQHGDNRQKGRIKYIRLAEGKIKFDRFLLNLDEQTLAYVGAVKSNQPLNVVGNVYNQWLQCKYTDRYSVFEGGFYYWLYEQVTLNVICLDEFDENIFINTQPTLVFEDVNNFGYPNTN
ncbi:MAG: hypothetical protein RLZ75_118 [Pseudomonadota bacterium]|jgi:hypothetical protein